MRKNTLFTVPLFCVAASLLTFFVVAFGVGRFAVVTGPDGSVSSDEGRVLLIYGCVFAAGLIIGGAYLFSRLTRKEICVSATVMVVYQLVIILLNTVLAPNGRLAMTFYYLSMAGEWCSFVPLVLYRLTGSLILSDVLGAFTPYVLVLFGKKRLE